MVVMSNDTDIPNAMSTGMSGSRLGRGLLIAIVLAAFLPEEITFYPFGIRLAISRVMLLIIMPFAIASFLRLVGSGKYRFLLSDLLVTLAGGWLIVAPIVVDGFAVIIKGTALAVDFWVAYWVFRTMPADEKAVLSVIKTLSVTASDCGLSVAWMTRSRADRCCTSSVLRSWQATYTLIGIASGISFTGSDFFALPGRWSIRSCWGSRW